MAGESIHQLDIMLGINADGVRRGFTTAAEEARHFQKQIEKINYAFDKKQPQFLGPSADTFRSEQAKLAAEESKIMESLIAEEKRMKAEFSAWYINQAEIEFQEWYALEQRKEDILQQQVLMARQTAMNTANAQTQQPQEMETLARARENGALQEAIVERYRLQDAANEATEQQDAEHRTRRARMRDDAVRQETNDYIQQQILLRNAREEAAAQEAIDDQRRASRRLIHRIRAAQEEANVARRTVQQNAQRGYDRDVADASRVIDRNRTATETYSIAVARLDALLHTLNRTTGRALLTDAQYAREKTRLTIAMIRQQQTQIQLNNNVQQYGHNAGRAAMAMGQMSYAAEDFIQVMSMGGGLNMALMSASNNLAMVARAVLPATGALAALAGIAVPVVLIGIGSLIRYLMMESDQVDAVTRAHKRLEDQLKSEHDTRSKMLELQFFREDLQNADSAAELNKQRIEFERELLRLANDRQQIEDSIAGIRDRAMQRAMQGFRAAQDILPVEQIKERIRALESFGADAKHLRIALKTFTEQYEQFKEGLATGTADDIQVFAERMQIVIDDAQGRLPGEFREGLDVFEASLQNFMETGNYEQFMEDLNTNAAELAGLQEDIAVKQQMLVDNQKELVRLKAEEVEQAFKAQQWRREELMLILKATDAEKERINIFKELEEFMGPNGLQDLGAMIGVDQIAIGFLEEKLKLLNAEMFKTISPEAKGDLEQNAYKAQAKAFDQTMKKSDDKLKQIAEKIDATNRLLNDIKNGNNPVIVEVN